jgi:hypothetical protein
MSGQVEKILTVEDAKFYIQSGLSSKKIEEMFSTQPVEVQSQVKALILMEKGKTPAQKMIEHLLTIIELRLDKEFLVYRDEYRNPAPLKKVSNNIVAVSSIEGLIEIAADELKLNGVKLPKSKVEEIVRTWEMNAKALDKLPRSFSLDPNELTFNLLNIHIADGPSPTFDNFIERCGANGPALAAFVWSIFEDVKLQQYVLLYGEGRDGKGSLFRLIEKLVGDGAFVGVSTQDPHWAAKVVGKRVATWSDVNSTAFVMSETFKAITGNDKVTITEKHVPSYSTRLDARLFIATNNQPEFTSRGSDMRRLLYCEVAGINPPIPGYEDKLLQEAPAILFKCREYFQKLYDPSLEIITCDVSQAKRSADEFETEFSAILDECFEIGSDFEETNNNVFNEVKQYFKYQSKYSAFKKWLNREFGIVETEVPVPNQKRKKKILKGLKLKYRSTT